jgi:hypothetical protein
VDTIHFEGRDVNSSAEYVDARELIEGETYFAVHFVDDRMLVPELRPLVFIGEDLEPGDSGVLYFQDGASHVAGMRYGDSATVHRIKTGTPFVLTFERALDALLRCSLARTKRG